MKLHLSLLFLLVSFSVFAQEVDLEENIQSLKVKIQQSEKGEKLKLLDSLTLLIRDRTAYKYDSISRVTINYALELDSINIATRNVADLIFYNCYVIAKPKEALDIFLNYKGFKSVNDVAKNNYRVAANFYLYGGDCYSSLGNTEKTLENYKIAEEFSFKAGDKRRVAVALLRTGFEKTEIGLFAEASQNIQKASKLFYEVKDTLHMVNSKNALSILYSQNAFYKEAEKVRNEAIKLAKLMERKGILGDIYYNASIDARMTRDKKAWISYLKLALSENEKSEYTLNRRTNFMSNLVIAYSITDSLPQAEKYLNEIEKNPKEYTEGINKRFYIEALKQIAFARKDYTNAIKYGKEHLQLTKNQDSFVEIYNAEKFLADIYFAIGKKNQANIHLNQYYSIKDSISSIQNVKTLAYYQTIYETEKKDLKIEAQESNIALLDSENKLKNQWLLFGGIGFLSVFGFVVLVRSRNTAKRRQLDQKKFTEQIVNTQEVERSRVAHELHDSVGQKLLILKNSLFLKENKQTDESNLLDETIKEVREMSHSLHPFQFEKVGLVTSLEDMVSAFQKSSDIFYSSEIEDILGMIPKEKEIFIFRMLQECMSNVEKHSGATGCNLSVIQENNHVIFQLKDNGKGFDVSLEKEKNKSLGMKTLEERARFIEADFSITSEEEKGTQVSIKIDKI